MLAPDLLAGLQVQAQEQSASAQRVHPVAVDGRRAPRADAVLLEPALVGVTPQLLRVIAPVLPADDRLLAVGDVLALLDQRDQILADDRDGRVAFPGLDLPQLLQTAGRPVGPQAVHRCKGVAMRTAP